MPPVLAAVLLGVALSALLVAFVLYVMPAKTRAENVHRRHLENLFSWERRSKAALLAQAHAAHAFMVEAERLGLTQWHHDHAHAALPRAHPVSIAYLRARYPDGPTLEELANLAGYRAPPPTQAAPAPPPPPPPPDPARSRLN